MPRTLCYILLFFGLGTSLLCAEVLHGVCSRVSDGDTLILTQPNRKELTIRLYGIDAPENSQDYGKAAKAMLSELVSGQHIRVVTRSTDRYGRIIARVYRDELDINLTLVQEGYAWHYVRYAPQALELAEAETLACASKAGLWQNPAPIPPWEYRHGARPALPNPDNHPYWISEHNILHNAQCKYFGVTQRGRYIAEPGADTTNCRLCNGTAAEPSGTFPTWWNLLLLVLFFFLLPIVLIRLLIIRARGEG